jgi:hypothetical protein
VAAANSLPQAHALENRLRLEIVQLSDTQDVLKMPVKGVLPTDALVSAYFNTRVAARYSTRSWPNIDVP